MGEKILFISLSNIGDCILSLPTLDLLLSNFPMARFTVIAGPRSKEVFDAHPNLERIILYNKHARFREKLKLFLGLRKEGFDIVIDLRNSLFGLLLPSRRRINFFARTPSGIKHARDKHLYRLSGLGFAAGADKKFFAPDSSDQEYIERLLRENNLDIKDRLIVVAPGARSSTKRWPKENFARLIPLLASEFQAKIVLVGDRDDAPINKSVSMDCSLNVLDLSGKTTLRQLGSLLDRASLVVTNDSSTMHLASYLNIPVAAVFGPTDDERYGPWSEKSAVIKREVFCRPCAKAQCRFGTLECLQLVKPDDVLSAAKKALIANCQLPIANCQFKRILIIRTDRIGDVVLSTPAIQAMREGFPNAYIAAMVAPEARQIVEANPYLDGVVILDKNSGHKGPLGALRLALSLRKKKFDLALILHPTNRVHWVAFLAGIPSRVGYNRKSGFLLTERVEHKKELGQKHELEYSLDLVRHLGISPQGANLFMPISDEAEQWLNKLLKEEGIGDNERLLVIHPGASCPSKIWPSQRFAEAAERVAKKHSFQILVIAGPKDAHLAGELVKDMRLKAFNLAGKTTISQLASVLKRASLLISNDSGPVHIAAALGTPVISIFGRKQHGLGPLRWGPQGRRARFLHRDVGCIECLAHNCIRSFACLQAIKVDDVVEAADSILSKA